MGLFSWIVFGAIAGWIASLIMGRSGRQGCIMNIVVGIVGALLGGLIMNLFGHGTVSGFNFYSLGVAIFGAVVLLLLMNLMFGKNR